jgi:hypothetical protein
MDKTNAIRVDEDQAFWNLLDKIPRDKYKAIAYKGRGGLSIVQKLAYALDITTVVNLDNSFVTPYFKDETLFVDDIECTSNTITDIIKDNNINTAVLVQRSSSLQLADYVGYETKEKGYVVFSWEVQDV